MPERKLLKVIDVNFNRLKEALRVVEDIFRFVLRNDNLRKKTRELRHSLDTLKKEKVLSGAIIHRDSEKDPGRKIDILELERKNASDLLYINLQRAKESLRVLEEFSKIVMPKKASFIKTIRYEVYSLEKTAYLFINKK